MCGPADTCFSCDGTPHIACHKCKVPHCALHASMSCQSEICVGCQFCAANLAVGVIAFAFVVACGINTCPSVWICRKWYVVPPQYPQNADGQLRNDQEFCTKLQGELQEALFGMCTKNLSEGGKRSYTYTKADLIFKRVFCRIVCSDLVGHQTSDIKLLWTAITQP